MSGNPSWDLVYLAMSQAAIGRMAEARANLRTAERCLGLEQDGSPLIPPETVPELRAILAEAKSAISRNPQRPPLDSDAAESERKRP